MGRVDVARRLPALPGVWPPDPDTPAASLTGCLRHGTPAPDTPPWHGGRDHTRSFPILVCRYCLVQRGEGIGKPRAHRHHEPQAPGRCLAPLA